ncbi:MAG: hypothetical protein KDA86_23450 [Planctomycetaceae bacterium]|nr:hypothetical protein [Planctomycetaceae bacterium]
MSTKHVWLAGATALILTSHTFAAAGNATQGDTTKDSPGVIIVEEDWFFPLRFDSITALNNARYHYRRNEEKAAANEVDKAISWLKYAEGHAMPVTKEKLTSAAEDLESVSKDLRAGNTIAAAHMDWSLARASHALAEWHYYKAKEHYGNNEAHYAAQHLESAVSHLQNAADSAHFEYGPDTVTVFDDVFKDGVLFSEDQTVDHNRLGKHLDTIKSAIEKVGEALNKS